MTELVSTTVMGRAERAGKKEKIKRRSNNLALKANPQSIQKCAYNRLVIWAAADTNIPFQRKQNPPHPSPNPFNPLGSTP